MRRWDLATGASENLGSTPRITAIAITPGDALLLGYHDGSVEGVDPGYFAVYIGTSPEKVDQALAGIRTELARVRDERVSAGELLRAKEHLMGTHEVGLQRNGARAGVMALDAAYGLGADRYLRYADEIAAVTAEQVQDVARRLIDFDKSALAIVGP